MGEQSAARLEGDRYQHLYSWYELLALLDEDSPYEYGYVEHPEAGSADDLTLHPKPDAGFPAKFIQVKWHVDHRGSYSVDSLIEAAPGKRSLLEKLFDSWQKLRANGPVEVWLVSNWTAAPAPDLGAFFRGRDDTLWEELLQEAPRSRRAREKWQSALAASDQNLAAFVKALRLYLGSGSIAHLGQGVDERMGRYSLRTGENIRSIVKDEVSTWVEIGGERKRITRDVLLEAIERRGLRAETPDEPTVSLWIHGFEKKAYGPPPTIELDWRQHFDRDSRRVPTQTIWDEVLLPELRQARQQLADVPDGSFIDFRGKLPLTAALAVGFSFPQVGDYRFRMAQPTGGTLQLWRSDATPSDSEFVVRHESGQAGGDILIALCITGDGWPDVQRLYEESASTLTAVVYAEPEGGTGQAAVKTDHDLTALAVSAKELVQEHRRKYSAHRTHLVLYAPASFALVLGQSLNAVRTIITYERTQEGGYQQSLTLQTE